MTFKNYKKKLFIYFFSIYLIIGSFLSGSIMLTYQIKTKEYQEKIKLNELNFLTLQKKLIKNNFENIVSDLLFLSRQNELLSLLTNNSLAQKKKISKEYLEFSIHKGKYDQVRFIDSTGMENVRVNYNNGSPQIVHHRDLQSKKNRYYFKETITLNEKKIYISPFDLNIEKGKVEQPLKPIIRFATPVFDAKKEKKGIIVLNYLGGNLIASLRTAAKISPGNIMLVNSDGFWLCCIKPEDEWGFILKERKTHTFPSHFYAEWNKINTNESTQIYNQNGMFSAITIYPNNLHLLHTETPATIENKNYYWKLISHIPNNILQSEMNDLLIQLFWLGFVLFLVSSIPAFTIAHTIIKKELHKLELFQYAHFDFLTKLPNRMLLMDRLDQAIKNTTRYNRMAALLYIDLDGFKNINDTLGHKAGDELLIIISRRLEKCIRSSDTAARVGGDEFVIILNSLNYEENAKQIAQKVIESISKPIIFKNHEKQVGASIGIITFSHDTESVDSLMKKADKAMYDAKKQGKNCYQVFLNE